MVFHTRLVDAIAAGRPFVLDLAARHVPPPILQNRQHDACTVALGFS